MPDGSVKPLSDVRGLPASGVLSTVLYPPVAQSRRDHNPGRLQPVRDGGGFDSLSNRCLDVGVELSARDCAYRMVQIAAHAMIDLETLLPQLDNELGFIGLKDHDTLPMAQTNIRVKGSGGLELRT